MTNELSVDALIKTIRIPARPSLLLDVQTELASREPDPRRLAAMIANDVAMSASLLKLSNSSLFGLRLKATSVEHAVSLLGMRQCGLLMTGIIARQAIQIERVPLAQFWDESSKRALAMSHLAQHWRVCSPDLAHTYGLFCDIGIPLLLERFPDYQQTLVLAQQQWESPFTAVEQVRHHTSHTSIGALMARTWALPEDISMAILLHHDYRVLTDLSTSETVRTLVALSLLADYAIHLYRAQEPLAEWEKGGSLACEFLGVGHDDIDDRFEEIHELFNHAHH
ncbi:MULTISPECIES: HDOD domain-containing protein [unclassified Undibacterium]|uniref:HDOD domain-containing protein n=1 Tax=unclassified Undibacterium TaxID=2630295 RepID=UPI002AC9CFB6|nr:MULTISPECIES: HDOD domain-containing protein [unclassified Undibacterium]MEB0140269.1 HDOD domain-containing protein [Undibacterium sp. CCC2.1]MEB0173317.1 HDOD domain-containing protein [Undibacterium sp. CCC1.1]MEB0177136.1 HDOD domain-containing protein [Undibacterium sp. CCC3.4]MEB0216408.1 HDOD domain-containing protein [Undibacterium sp. 5I2]WPX45537.1 HDOD domain-containing protein [Undibacterium sp. CCC3.4]